METQKKQSRSASTLNLPLFHRQLQALHTTATELLFGGASEGGKSHFVRVALIGWCLAIQGLQCVLIRKKFDDILNNHVYGEKGFKALLAPLIEKGLVEVTQKEIRFNTTGSRIAFMHCQDERQFTSAQGVEKHVIVIDEATQISERLIKFFRAWCRMSKETKETLPENLRDRFPKIIYTANPIGVSVGYFRRHFVKARPAFSIELVGGFKRQYIPSRVYDNPAADLDAHIGRLSELGDAALAKALHEGDWDAPLGDFYPEWNEERHVIEDCEFPSHWYRFGTFDWGTAEPFAVYWWAVSDGESFIDHNGNTRWYPRGALIAYREWYGCNPEKPAEGIRWRNEDIAYGIVQRSRGEGTLVFLSDSLPFQDRGGKTIAETFRECGVELLQGDTSRIAGWSQLRSRLIGKFIDSNDAAATSMIYFTESCAYARESIPALPRHPLEHKKEDAAEHGEATHAADAIRLACMARPIIREKEPEIFDSKNVRNDFTFNAMLKKVQRIKATRNGARY